jgi:glycosyltransferase involved in cell wall biosynthesis
MLHGAFERTSATRSTLFLRCGSTMRLAVYNDQGYWSDGEAVYAARAFVVFLNQLAEELDSLIVVGRLDPRPGRSHYRLSDKIEFAPLPFYSDASNPLSRARTLVRSARRFWRVLDEVDGVWLLGPYPVSIVFVVLAAIRRRRVTLGVRQDMPQYVRNRHPGRRGIQLAASLLERVYRLLARRYPVIVVGPELAAHYSGARALLQISVSLVRERDLLAPEAHARSYDGGELDVISVGRLDPEKNPLLLADVLARLREHDPRWRLIVCGDGPLERELADRLRALGLDQHAELHGHVPIDGGLMDLYRHSHFFLHVSFTEGLPQVLLEAFAARLPVVATAVGGVAEAVGGAAVLIPPGDPEAAAGALKRLARDRELREHVVDSGARYVRGATIEAECARVTHFIAGNTPATRVT